MPAEAATEAPAEATDIPAAPTGNTLEAVRSRGTLRCAGNQSVPGFGYINPDTNEFEGFDIDFCRVFAVAALGDATALEVRPTTANERFPVLQSGEVDVLSRNTTMTISRDTSLGLDFAPVTFYDGQGMMVRADMNIDSLEGLEGGTICVQSGTTTEKNLADVFRARGIDFTRWYSMMPTPPATPTIKASATASRPTSRAWCRSKILWPIRRPASS